MRQVKIIYSPEMNSYLKGYIFGDPQWTKDVTEAAEVKDDDIPQVLEHLLVMYPSHAVNFLEIKVLYLK